ncbi:MAG TPA: 5,6-dimethylbenzimidazole synthase [Candidatus Dormibacteraeota bacterium]|jgi:5,6-dimethylbenzimidazole synthase|nr:5,6-dimethylbenzimidazole synthase [Candidatus Dormibacteraeota bacterium]
MSDERRHRFAEPDREAVYRAIHQRRDVRHFRTDAVDDTLVYRVLAAAHRAPSVGFMQPWTFTVIRSAQTREHVHALYLRERQAAACFLDEPRRSEFLALKLEGIREAPVNICVSCDPTRGGVHVLGRNSQPETDVYSTCCAVQNLWLAARAEGLGVGWVSIIKTGELREILGIPPHVVPVAYLCLGWPQQLRPRPMLEEVGWRERLSMAGVVRLERYDAAPPAGSEAARAVAAAEAEITGWEAAPGPA